MMQQLAEAICNYAGNDPELRRAARAAANALRPELQGVRLEQARDAAVELGIFSQAQFASTLGVTEQRARELLEQLPIVHEERTPFGRLWVYEKPGAGRVVERRRFIPEWEMAASAAERGTVEGVTHRGRRVGGNTAWNRFLGEVRRAGGKIKKLPNGHVLVTGPRGKTQVASTPRGSSFDSYRKRIRETAGLSV